MTLHSQTAFNHHNPEKGRSFTPLWSVQRYTPDETRALEDWWLAKMPRAGKSRGPKNEQSRGYAEYKRALIEAVQDWVSLTDLVLICDMRREPVNGFLHVFGQRNRIESSRYEGEMYYRLTDEARRYGYRFTDPAAVIVPFLNDWMTTRELADAIGCSTNFLSPELSELCTQGVVARERRGDGWHYIRAGMLS